MSEMVEVQTSELIGIALDWAVAKATDEPIELIPANPDWGTVAELKAKNWLDRIGEEYDWSPSSDWDQIGPLLTKYRIEFKYASDDVVKAVIASGVAFYPVPGGFGPDHLIAACRAIVLHELSQAVMVPKELLS